MKPLCHPGDLAALLAVKAGFPNASYVEHWTPDVPCCEWNGITCDDADDYVHLHIAFLRDANLTGAIPGAAIAHLTRLSGLAFLHVPGVSGAIPPLLAGASGLTSLSHHLPHRRPWARSPRSCRSTSPSTRSPAPSRRPWARSRASPTSTSAATASPAPSRRCSSAAPARRRSSRCRTTGSQAASPAVFAGVNFVQADLSGNGLAGDASSVMFGRGSHRLLLDSLDLSRNNLSFDMSRLEFQPILGYLDVSHNEIHGGSIQA
ncbi:hypothetical protein ACP4OV_016092 [Aristida adscensionis]